MKILSDFDGVMTEQSEEADRALAIFEDHLERISGVSSDSVSAWIESARVGVDARPHAYGWLYHGRVSAYSDEDLFIRNISLASWMDERAAAGEAPFADVLQRLSGTSAHKSFDGLCGWAYQEMTRETSAGKLKPMDPIVGETISGLLAANHDIVVVSNSGTDRVMALLETTGLSPERYSEGSVGGPGCLRVRGGARKFELAETPESFSESGRSFEVSRPRYVTILNEEKPDVVIGDVFSLDLALPLFMARGNSDAVPADLHVMLRRRAYTPDWAVQLFTAKSADTVRFHIMDHFGELPEMIA